MECARLKSYILGIYKYLQAGLSSTKCNTRKVNVINICKLDENDLVGSC